MSDLFGEKHRFNKPLMRNTGGRDLFVRSRNSCACRRRLRSRDPEDLSNKRSDYPEIGGRVLIGNNGQPIAAKSQERCRHVGRHRILEGPPEHVGFGVTGDDEDDLARFEKGGNAHRDRAVGRGD